MNERFFTIALSISMTLHLAFVAGGYFGLPWLRFSRVTKPVQVVYEAEGEIDQEVARVEQRISEARREATLSGAMAPIGQDHAQIRIPDRPVLSIGGPGGAGGAIATSFVPARSTVVDLTNLVAAAGGNPVLLSYFSVIREQIQQAANRQPWTPGESAQGMVMVSFLLTASGAIQGAAVVPEKSAPSEALRNIAVQIVRTAAPFPPFPPSIPESSKQIVVPLEFLLGM